MRQGAAPWIARALFAIIALAAYPYFSVPVKSVSSDGVGVFVGLAYLVALILQVIGLIFVWLSVAPQCSWLRAKAWVWISAYYYVGAVFAAALAGRLSVEGYLPLITIGMAIGAFTLAATADYCMTMWESRPLVRSDISTFLVGTHTLATLNFVGFLTDQIWSGGDPISESLTVDGAVALTILAIPLCAGLWARLRSAPETMSIPPASHEMVVSSVPRSTSLAQLLTGAAVVVGCVVIARSRKSRGT